MSQLGPFVGFSLVHPGMSCSDCGREDRGCRCAKPVPFPISGCGVFELQYRLEQVAEDADEYTFLLNQLNVDYKLHVDSQQRIIRTRTLSMG